MWILYIYLVFLLLAGIGIFRYFMENNPNKEFSILLMITAPFCFAGGFLYFQFSVIYDGIACLISKSFRENYKNDYDINFKFDKDE